MSMRAPAELKGNGKLEKWINDLLRYAVSTEIKSVIGGRLERGTNGTRIVVKR